MGWKYQVTGKVTWLESMWAGSPHLTMLCAVPHSKGCHSGILHMIGTFLSVVIHNIYNHMWWPRGREGGGVIFFWAQLHSVWPNHRPV